jgi:hypothetical protein
VQADRDGAHCERQADDDVAHKERREADVLAQAGVLKKLQQAHTGDERWKHERPKRKRDQRLARAKAMAREREGERQREQRADERGDGAKLQAEPQRIDPFRRERAAPPLQREAARRKLRPVRFVERDRRGDQDRTEHEHVHEDHRRSEGGPRRHGFDPLTRGS